MFNIRFSLQLRFMLNVNPLFITEKSNRLEVIRPTFCSKQVKTNVVKTTPSLGQDLLHSLLWSQTTQKGGIILPVSNIVHI